MSNLPRWVWPGVAVFVLASLVPLAMILRARTVRGDSPHVHPILDMDAQPKFKTQSANPMFADGRAMRPPVPGAVRFQSAHPDPALREGRAGDGWVEVMPVAITMPLLRRGQQRFDIYCAPCHGLAGFGDGVVAKRAEALMEGTWTPPTSLHDPIVRGREDGHIYNTITNGIRNMPAYGPQLDVADRWAIVAYVRALQRSQDADVSDVPADLRGSLR